MTLSKFIKSVATVILGLSMLSLSNTTLADEAIASGKFEGASGHATSGSVSIVKTASGLQVVLGDDFMFDGAPDAKVGFKRMFSIFFNTRSAGGVKDLVGVDHGTCQHVRGERQLPIQTIRLPDQLYGESHHLLTRGIAPYMCIN